MKTALLSKRTPYRDVQLLCVLYWMRLVVGFPYFSVGKDHMLDSILYECISQLML